MADNKEDDVTIVKEVSNQCHFLYLNKLINHVARQISSQVSSTIFNFQTSKITVQVKTPKEKQSVEIEENVTVRKVNSDVSNL